MKKIALLIFILFSLSCQKKAKDYVNFSGKITNKNSDSIIIGARGFYKFIKVEEDGTFNDTLSVQPGIYRFYDGTESTSVFLKNGYTIKASIDANRFNESTKFTGLGSENSNFLLAKSLLEEKLMNKNFENLDQQSLENTFASIKKQMTVFIKSTKGLDTMMTNISLRNVDGLVNGNKGYFEGILRIKKLLPKGTPSPTFKDYDNYNGNKTSLKDLNGSYAYIDIWATWCKPCIDEMPALKQLENDYQGENIQFVSISIDDDRSHNDSWKQAKENWKAMIVSKELGGIQLFAPKGWNTSFIEDYMVRGIPRFILIDPDGNILNASAPRPSDPSLRTVFDELLR